jgi:hypothetical protein
MKPKELTFPQDARRHFEAVSMVILYAPAACYVLITVQAHVETLQGRHLSWG